MHSYVLVEVIMLLYICMQKLQYLVKRMVNGPNLAVQDKNT